MLIAATISLLGRALLNRKPCASLQPSARRQASSASVSTPSAVMVTPRPRAKADDGAHDRLRVAIGVEAAHEGAVDLDLVEREAAQIAQRRIAGAEIVHARCARRARAAHAASPSTCSLWSSSSVSVISSSSRCGGRPGLLQRRHDDGEQIAGAELERRQVDRDACTLRPVRRRRCRRGAGRGAERAIRPVSSATGMNSDGGIMPRSRMVPAHQRLVARDLAGREIDQRLVMRLERIGLHRRAQVRPRAGGAPAARIHPGSKKAKVPRPSRLGAIERQIGVLQQRVGIGRRRPAPTAMPIEAPIVTVMAVDQIGLADADDQALAPSRAASSMRSRPACEDREFVAAEPRDQRFGAQRGSAAACATPLQQHVAESDGRASR